MPYALAVLDEAVVQLREMLSSVPTSRWDAIIDEIDRQLLVFSETPTVRRPLGTILSLPIVADGVLYRWAVAWYYDQSEQRIVIARFGRDSRTIL